MAINLYLAVLFDINTDNTCFDYEGLKMVVAVKLDIIWESNRSYGCMMPNKGTQ